MWKYIKIYLSPRCCVRRKLNKAVYIFSQFQEAIIELKSVFRLFPLRDFYTIFFQYPDIKTHFFYIQARKSLKS